MVKRYVTDRRELFRDDHEFESAVMEVLDVFVDAGWPEARLVYGLADSGLLNRRYRGSKFCTTPSGTRRLVRRSRAAMSQSNA
jgi:hypothetical protein